MALVETLNQAKGLLLSYPDNYSDDVALSVDGIDYPTCDTIALGRLFNRTRFRGNLAAFICFAGADVSELEDGSEWEDVAANVSQLRDDEAAILFAPFGMPKPGESRSSYQLRESIARINQVLAAYSNNDEKLGALNGLLEQINQLRASIEVTTRLASEIAFTAQIEKADVMGHLSDCDVYACRAAMACREEISVARLAAKAKAS